MYYKKIVFEGESTICKYLLYKWSSFFTFNCNEHTFYLNCEFIQHFSSKLCTLLLYIWSPVGFESDEAVISGLRKLKALANFNLTKSRNLWFRDIQLMKIFPNTSKVGLRPDCYFDTHYLSVSRTSADPKPEGCCINLYILKITRFWYVPNGVTVNTPRTLCHSEFSLCKSDWLGHRWSLGF